MELDQLGCAVADDGAFLEKTAMPRLFIFRIAIVRPTVRVFFTDTTADPDGVTTTTDSTNVEFAEA